MENGDGTGNSVWCMPILVHNWSNLKIEMIPGIATGFPLVLR